MQPAANGLGIADRWSLACQHQKRRLKHVLDIFTVGQRSSAHPPHQRRMPLHQPRKGVPIAGSQEAAQQLAVRLVGIRLAAGETLDMLQQ